MGTTQITTTQTSLYTSIQNSSSTDNTQLFKNHNFDGTDNLSGIKVQLASGGYVAKEDTYRASSTKQKNFLNQVTDELTDGFILSPQVKSDLITASITQAKMLKNPSVSNPAITLNDIIVEMNKILEVNDNDNAKPPVTVYDTTYINSTRDVSLRDSISNAKDDNGYSLFKDADFTYTFSDKQQISELFIDGETGKNYAAEEYLPAYDNANIYASIDILTAGFTLNDDVKGKILAEALSLGDPTSASVMTINDVITNISKVLERYDSNLELVKNKGDVVHDDTAMMWTKGSAIEKQAGVKTVYNLFKQFNPDTNGNIKLDDAMVYFKNLLDDMDATELSYAQLDTILKAGNLTGSAATGNATTIEAFRNAIRLIESSTTKDISSSIMPVINPKTV